MKIIKDTREKIGSWDFCDAEVIVQKLDTGDYTLVDYEDYICIERKKSTTEVATNLGVDIKRFTKELERMKEFPLAYIICEFTLQSLLQFPVGSGLSQKQMSEVRINGKYLVKLLSSFKDKYGVEVLYCGSREKAIAKAEEIFQSVTEIRG